MNNLNESHYKLSQNKQQDLSKVSDSNGDHLNVVGPGIWEKNKLEENCGKSKASQESLALQSDK